MDYIMNKRVQTRVGNRDEIMAPHNCYPCKGEDKWVSIAIATEEEWDCFCNAIGNPEWAQDERFADAYWRWRNQDELDKLISEWTINYTHYEVMDILQKVGVAAVPSFNSQELYNDPHLKERGFSSEVAHPVMGKVAVVGPPWELSETPARIYRHAPLFGEHNDYVFRDLLGMSDDEFARLVEEKVIY
jgi:benzylsuccinate CoA-transferase BbsF subunit